MALPLAMLNVIKEISSEFVDVYGCMLDRLDAKYY
jgi:hypothetical protein